MGERIGLDFGTTYSVIARIRNEQAEAVGLAEGGNVAVDSIVAENTHGMKFYGSRARGRVERGDDYHIYKGFKMLLSEENNEEGKNRLKEYGFSNSDEPAKITELFLRYLIDNYKDRYVQDIDRLVIGVPEVWFSTSINSRSKLQEIASRIVGDEKVQLESEPKLACAYLVHNYNRNHDVNFVGNILLVDFGGGTLDIAVCEVNNRQGHPEISIIYKTGAGANEQKIIGNAGLAFLEHVVNIALSDAEINDFAINREYYKCIHRIENELMSTPIREIKEVFQDALRNPNVLSEEFCRVEYNDVNDIVVTYKMLSDAYYTDDISRVFEEKLTEVRSVLDEKGINYKDGNSDNFKIALVGGFGNFYLTQKQMENTEGFKKAGENDDHRYDMHIDGEDREKAVAYGAALLANNVVTFAKQAPYSLFILPHKEEERGRKIPDDSQPFIAFIENEKLEFDKPYMVRKVDTDEHGNMVVDADGKPVSMEVKFNGGKIPFIRKVVGREKFDGRPSIKLDLPPRTIKIGFSLDRNYILSLHIYECNPGDPKETETKKRLSDINDLLGGLPNTTEEV